MLFDKTSEALVGASHYAGIRHKVIANNIANVDTPGYRAMDISFGDQLADIMRTPNSRGMESMAPPSMIFTQDLNGQRPSINGNTVSIDQQLTMLSQNAIYNNACLQLLRSKYRILKAAISPNS